MAGTWRRSRRFGMRIGRENTHTRIPSLLPLTTSPVHLSNTVSCCYCDYKITSFNQPLFLFGRRHSRFLRVWFSIGIGFSIAAVLGVTLILLLELVAALHIFDTTIVLRKLPLSSSSFFGFSSLLSNWSLSPLDAGYIFISTVISVAFHEFGHAVAATSEGVQLEYIAVFVALLFPGALVAFSHELLQASPGFTALRVYSAGIWHNAVFAAACGLVLFFMPFVLFPFYIHGQSPMVLGVSSTSPLYGYLSPGDVIVSLDGTHIHNAQDWIEMSTLIHELSFRNANISKHSEPSRPVNGRNGYCVPNSVLEESQKVRFGDNESTCASDLAAFETIPCVTTRMLDNGDPDRRDGMHCLNAKDVVKLGKCRNGWDLAVRNGSSCLCSQDKSCLTPVQIPGLAWVEITYSSPYASECVQLGGNALTAPEECGRTFVFVGDVISMAQSVWLTSYQPRWAFGFAAYLPDVLERIFMASFHVSLALALLNSLPVYYLDGESLIEAILFHFTSLSPRKKEKALQAYLLGGTLISILAFLRIFFNFVQL